MQNYYLFLRISINPLWDFYKPTTKDKVEFLDPLLLKTSYLLFCYLKSLN